MSILEENSLAILRAVYEESENNNKELNLDEILKKITIPNITKEDIKYSVEYLNDSGYLTYRNYPILNDICITLEGKKYYHENFI